jgi:hypothetical protein
MYSCRASKLDPFVVSTGLSSHRDSSEGGEATPASGGLAKAVSGIPYATGEPEARLFFSIELAGVLAHEDGTI